MHKNGVAHLVAEHDLHGINRIMRWLSFVPECRDAPLPIWRNLQDPVDRDIDVVPSSVQCDPRTFLAGKMERDENGIENWMSGFFDRGTFMETLAGWARSVVVGRARLGGIPMGVIAVETRTVDRVIPADPANADSEEQVHMEAGQVWYPNSAYKTAQAIRDFNNGEQLPLIIFANWRGFSGGQRDMFHEILKYGSFIVDALVAYRQPVFVYVVPNGELRGGAWVVLDPTINPDCMEMYADETSRAGVLEPEGIVDVKFRRSRILEVMARLDERYRSIKQQLDSPGQSATQRAELKAQLDARERELQPVYRQVALQFADLHDTPGRMHAKGAIRKVLCWRDARRFFHARLRRRLAEERVFALLHAADKDLPRSTMVKELHARWLNSGHGEDKPSDDNSDVAVADWLESAAGQKAIADWQQSVCALRVRTQVAVLAGEDHVAAIQGLAAALKAMSVEQRSELLSQLGLAS
ncbi:ClpP/crotonase-like domain-containing protein [Thamnocephalis sphaerospora]|uniref:ClpP/crotonase-like domain-containing protein n=1 Tax=Thamnocephalis sphaerospora TaxID=78915 RepID=A0A4V1IWH9_9FUNG|nr:ClpP/crotonase-like domain-containing protein [Thamnocephalis sphaerospora]|eukprot:RKP07619.1 ClpP/crotonase-like domain-containing protein [Thamnocephalis sphaerospora]